MQALLENLNEKQLDAVLSTQGPVLILAGAGTGKTTVLTCRIANILYNNLAYPNNILAVTFTNKAANEMHTRINKMIDAPGLNLGTFHSIASRILRRDIELLQIGVDKNFSIANYDDQVKLTRDILKKQNIDIKQFTPKSFCSIISRWKDQGLLPSDITQAEHTSDIRRMAHEVYKEYQCRLHESNALDFGDLLLYNNQLFNKCNEVLLYYQNKYRYILIDEYQDTNAVQYSWVRMLSLISKNICCVGDDDQSIYSWRGAEIKNILRFSHDFPDAKIITLDQNYRSSSTILTAASGLISNNSKRHDKSLWTKRSENEKIKIVSCFNEQDEARFIANEIQKLTRSGNYSLDNIAILVRSSFQTRAFEEVFISNALPYNIIGGLKFYDRMEIRDVLAYIRLTVNNNDNLALERIINTPKRSIGTATINKIKEFAYSSEVSIFHAIERMLDFGLLKNKNYQSLKIFVENIYRWQNSYKTQNLAEVTRAILEGSGYFAMIKSDNDSDSRSRLENIEEMLRVIGGFSNITDFIEHSSLVMDEESQVVSTRGNVRIMTFHAAKGLEFDLVFLPGWEEGVFPHYKILQEENPKSLEEERRIAYVGITRAKRDLYISFAKSRKTFMDFHASQKSRFLLEIPESISYQFSSNKQFIKYK
ncbi:MAG: ATP-dependent helicase [Rickettsiaceae bacterium]